LAGLSGVVDSGPEQDSLREDARGQTPAKGTPRANGQSKEVPMASGLFREKALARISSPEQLDQLLRMSSPALRLALAAMAGLFACALVWGFYGSLPTKVSGQGIVLRSSGVFTVSAQSAGEVRNLYFVKGGSVSRGQILAKIAQPVLADKVKAARSALAGLRDKYELTKTFGNEDIRLNLESLSQRRKLLDADIANLRDQLGWYGERVRAMTPFVAEGTISRMQLFEFQRELANTHERLSQKTNDRNAIESQILELKNRVAQQILDLENQIASAEDNLLAAVDSLETNVEVVSPYSGRVVEAGVNVGSIVASGSPIATLERAEGEVAYLEAILYFSPDQGQRIKEGMVVQVSPDTAKQERYGSMLALATKVTAYPSSQAEMARVLQNPELVRQLGSGVKIAVRCVLVPDHATASGYKWSSSRGPDFTIEPGAMCRASVIVERQRPINLVIPLFNRYVLGQGVRETPAKP